VAKEVPRMTLNKSMVGTAANVLIVCSLAISLVAPLDIAGVERPGTTCTLRRARSEHEDVLDGQVIVRGLAARLDLVLRGHVVLAPGQRRHFEPHVTAVPVRY